MADLLAFTAKVKNTSPNHVVIHPVSGSRTLAIGEVFDGEFTEGELKAMEAVYEVTRGSKAKSEPDVSQDAPKLTKAQQAAADKAAAAQAPVIPAVPLPGLPALPGATS